MLVYFRSSQNIPTDIPTNSPRYQRTTTDCIGQKIKKSFDGEGVLGPRQICPDENLVPQEGLAPPTPKIGKFSGGTRISMLLGAPKLARYQTVKINVVGDGLMD